MKKGKDAVTLAVRRHLSGIAAKFLRIGNCWRRPFGVYFRVHTLKVTFVLASSARIDTVSLLRRKPSSIVLALLNLKVVQGFCTCI